jgi:hypothetical protein
MESQRFRVMTWYAVVNKDEVEICFDPRQKVLSRTHRSNGRSDLGLKTVNASAPPIFRVFYTTILDIAIAQTRAPLSRTSTVTRQGAIG